MLLGIEHLVRQLFLGQEFSQHFRVLDRGRAHQHRLAALVALADVLDRGFVFFACGLVDAVLLVFAPARAVRRHHHGLQAVDLLEFVGFGVGRAGHAGELAVETEIVLERDRSHGLVFRLDLDALFRLHGLMQALAPAPARHQTARELVDDHDLAVLHHVMLVAVEQVVGAQGRVQVVHQRDVGRVVERGALRDQAQAGQDALGALVALLGQEDLAAFLVEREVARLGDALAGARIFFAFLALQQRCHLVDGDVEVGMVFGLAADDQRRARLVDQDRIDLVDDGVVEAALDPVRRLVDHVVAQVVKAVLVVRAVGDVGAVGRLLGLALHVRQVDADRQTQEVVELAHPDRVAIGEVVVDRHHVHALAAQGIEVDRHGGGQGLAFAGSHFRNLAMVQGHAAEQLHIEMAHLHDALGALAHDGERFRQQGVQRLALRNPVLELLRLAAQGFVRQLLEPGFQRIDAHHAGTVLFEQAVVATAENFGEDIGNHECKTDRSTPLGQPSSAILCQVWMKWGHWHETQPR